MKAKATRKILQLGKDNSYEVVDLTKKTKKSIQFLSVGLATEIGYSIAVPLVLGAMFGVWLDGKFDSKPKLTLSFLFLGLFISFARLYKIVNVIIKGSKK